VLRRRASVLELLLMLGKMRRLLLKLIKLLLLLLLILLRNWRRTAEASDVTHTFTAWSSLRGNAFVAILSLALTRRWWLSGTHRPCHWRR
jgi:hypothetical protein